MCVCVCVYCCYNRFVFPANEQQTNEHETPQRTHLQTLLNSISFYIFVTSRPVEKKVDVWYDPPETTLLTGHVISGNLKLHAGSCTSLAKVHSQWW